MSYEGFLHQSLPLGHSRPFHRSTVSFMSVSLLSLSSCDYRSQISWMAATVWCIQSSCFSYHVTYRSSFNVISCKVFIDINVIGDAKTVWKWSIILHSFPSDTKNAHINIYKEYQNRNLKLETIFYRDPWIPEYLAGLWKLVLEILLLGLVHNQIYN